VSDFIKQRRRNYAGHLHLKEKYGYRVSSMESGRVLRLAWGELLGALRLIWLLFALASIEAISRVLGWWDYRVRKQKHVVWDIAWTTKEVKAPLDTRDIHITSPHSPTRRN
jgi:biofilm PGA synthesis N-glycosyltransferase PgaC